VLRLVERIHRGVGTNPEAEAEGVAPGGQPVARVRRSAHIVFRLQDSQLPDLTLLLRGEVGFASYPQLTAVAVAGGEECPLSRADVELLLELGGSEFVPAESLGAAPETIERLVDAGLLVADDDAGTAPDEAVDANHWSGWAAAYHSASRWRGVDFAELDLVDADEGALAEAAEQLIRAHGEPPPHFHSVAGVEPRVPLPRTEPGGQFYDVLRARRTTRSFDRDSSLPLDRVSTLLATTFGCRGLAPLGEHGMIVKKTSPSGGGLHPTEAYPIVVRVDGLEPGVYHYEVGSHSLALLEPLPVEEAEELALAFACGQTYLAGAAMYVVMTSRFARLNWKYRDHDRAYVVALMDVAHLSQTFYLVSTELGLGAFLTAAINVGDIDARLGIDGFAEGAVAICGCGVPLPAPGPFEPAFDAFSPENGS
jgi:putative peptide maturation dehydrogenase